MFEEIFKFKKPDTDKLSNFGFIRRDDNWRYDSFISGGAFHLYVTVCDNGKIDTDLVDTETGEPYVLYKTDAAGTFVGQIRTAVSGVLAKIAENCFEQSVFKTRQADTAIEFIRKNYGDELEFLWPKFPDNAIWRRKDNAKWYGVILTVAASKIGLDLDGTVEIIDLRMDPKDKDEILSKPGHYPGWHMNKNSWYTIVLDGCVSDEELKSRISDSYILAVK